MKRPMLRRINLKLHWELMAAHKRAEAAYQKRKRQRQLQAERTATELITELAHGVDVGRAQAGW